MVAVAIVAMSCAAARVGSAPGAAVAIVGACVSYLAFERYCESVARREAGGATIGRLKKAVLLLESALIATEVIRSR